MNSYAQCPLAELEEHVAALEACHVRLDLCNNIISMENLPAPDSPIYDILTPILAPFNYDRSAVSTEGIGMVLKGIVAGILIAIAAIILSIISLVERFWNWITGKTSDLDKKLASIEGTMKVSPIKNIEIPKKYKDLDKKTDFVKKAEEAQTKNKEEKLKVVKDILKDEKIIASIDNKDVSNEEKKASAKEIIDKAVVESRKQLTDFFNKEIKPYTGKLVSKIKNPRTALDRHDKETVIYLTDGLREVGVSGVHISYIDDLVDSFKFQGVDPNDEEHFSNSTIDTYTIDLKGAIKDIRKSLNTLDSAKMAKERSKELEEIKDNANSILKTAENLSAKTGNEDSVAIKVLVDEIQSIIKELSSETTSNLKAYRESIKTNSDLLKTIELTVMDMAISEYKSKRGVIKLSARQTGSKDYFGECLYIYSTKYTTYVVWDGFIGIASSHDSFACTSNKAISTNSLTIGKEIGGLYFTYTKEMHDAASSLKELNFEEYKDTENYKSLYGDKYTAFSDL
jgi:hypothetical protein